MSRKTHIQRGNVVLRAILSLTLAFATSVVMVSTPGTTDKASAAGTDGGSCVAAGATAPTTTTYAIQASHGKVLYIDTGQGQRIDAAYVGYRIVKGSSTPASADVWVKLDGFDSSEVVQLASKSDEKFQLGTYTTGTKAAYFLLKAPKPTTAAQTHTVRVFEGNPQTGGVEKYFCSFTFDKVRETIKASANKVDSVTSTSSSYIGGDLVVTHRGLTGTIGAGSLPDKDVIWVSPASNSSWPTRAYRLTGVTTTYYDTKSFSGNSVSKTDELILKPAVNGIGTNKTPSSYQAVYTFKIIGPGSGAIAPVAQISSGTQIKHTDMSGFYNADGSAKFTASSTSLPISLTASKAGTGSTQSGADVNIGYRITLSNSGTTDLIVDSVIDTASSSLSFKTGTATKGSTPTSISDPASTAGPTGYNNLTFQGPFTVPANGTLPINYTMKATCATGSQTYLNSVQAKLGDLTIGSSAGQYNQVNTSMTQSVSGSTCTVSNASQTTSNLALPVEVSTGAAKNVDTTTANGSSTSAATITGTVDSNGTAGSSIQCESSTDSALAGSTFSTVTTPASGVTSSSTAPIQVECALTGLLPGTTYYYRVVVGPNAGEILSFTTPMPIFDSPTATTNSVSNLSGSGQSYLATFNSTVNSRGNPSRVAFEYKLSDSSGSGTTCSTANAVTSISQLDKNDAGTAINLVLTGLYETSVSYDITGLASNTRYCYRVLANYDWTATSETAGSASVATPVYGAWVNFKTSSVNPPSPTTNPASSVAGTSATLNGSVTAGDNQATAKYCYTTTAPSTGILADCLGATPPQTATTGSTITAAATLSNTYSATGLTAGTKYYFQVIATDSTGELIYANIESFTTPGPPIATTNAATSVASTTATINGQVQANGAATDVYFCYIAATAFADSNSDGYMDSCITSSLIDTSKTVNTTITAQIASADTANRSANLTGLTANTLYKFQVLAKNSNGEAKGEILSFTTEPLPPEPTTVAASAVSYTSATLNSSVLTKSYSANITFCISIVANISSNSDCLTGKLGTVSGGSMSVNSNATPSVSVTGLSTNTVYYFRVTATPSVGSAVNGSVLSFTTLTQGPAPTTNAATSISYTSATLNGSVTSNTFGTTNSFCISTTGTADTSTIGTCLTGVQGTVTGSTQSANASSSTSVSVTGLTNNTTYYFKVIATPSTGTAAEGLVKSFTTVQIIDPTPVTVAADTVGTTTARLRSNIASNTFALSSISFCISAAGTTGTPGTIGNCTAGTAATISSASLVANSSATPTQTISGLTSNTIYYFRVSVTDSQGNIFSGGVLSFTTNVITPTATTDAASPVGAQDAHLNGSTQTGTFGGAVTFCLSTTGSVGGNTIGTCGSGTQGSVTNASPSALTSSSHNVEITGLSPSTTYYFRITITPSTGPAVNGAVRSFTTNALGAPTAQTDVADEIGETSAKVHGEIMGGANGATATFCISTVGNTAANTIGNTCNEGTQGTISAGTAGTNLTANPYLTVTGLTPGTTYYFRVIATPTTGSAVSGIVRSFTTDTAPTATTNAVQSLLETSATLPGTVVAGTRSLTITFCLSTTGNASGNTIGACDTSKLGTVSNAAVSPNTTVNSSVAATGLTGGTTYYYRVIASPSVGTTASGNVTSFTTTAAAVNNNNNGGGGGGGGGGGSATPPAPTRSPAPVVTPRPNNSPTPSRTTAPVPIPLPSAAPAPAPRVTPRPIPPVQAAPSPAPITTVAKNLNEVLTKVSELIQSLTTPKPISSAAVEPSIAPSKAPAPEQENKVSRVEVADPPTSVVTTQKPDGTKDVVNAATRTVSNVASEKISGFAPGAGLRIEVIGSRIAGQFIVAPGEAPDPVTIAAAIQESTARQKTSFASIDSVVRVIPPAANEIFNSPITAAQEEIFKASGLSKPQSLSYLAVTKSTKWIQVNASAKTYLPGTVVYLTVTTQPIIFGEALVDKFGKASLKGSLPIDLLQAGGHSIRLVGVRSLEGVATDGNGEITLTNAAVDEIKKFDDGTKATVIISGASESGGAQTVVREVPLDRIIPWWTVWLALIVGLLAFAARFIRRPVSKKRRLTLIVLTLAAGVPAAVLGWLNVVYEVWIGFGVALVFTILQLFWGRKKRNR